MPLRRPATPQARSPSCKCPVPGPEPVGASDPLPDGWKGPLGGLALSHAIADFRASDYPTPMRVSFGPDWQKDLWASPFRLRFGLNDGGVDPEAPPATYVNMFTMSYGIAARECAWPARLISRLQRNSCCPLPTQNPDLGEIDKWRYWTRASAFSQLKDIGVATKPARSKWSGQLYPGICRSERRLASLVKHRAVDLSWDQADILLWSNIAQDLGVRPVAPGAREAR